MDPVEDLDRGRSFSGALEPDVGCQQWQVQFRSKLNKQGVIHAQVLPGRQPGGTLQPIGGRFMYDHSKVIDDADRRRELFYREPPGQQALLPQDSCDLDPREVHRLYYCGTVN